MRSGGDGRNRKQSMAELKLRRLQELNARLKEDLERRRIPVSEAANEYVIDCLQARMRSDRVLIALHSLISFTEKEPKDFMVPSKWGTVSPSFFLAHPYRSLTLHF